MSLSHPEDATDKLLAARGTLHHRSPPDAGISDILEEGIRRLLKYSTWKLWAWQPEGMMFFDADSFK